MTDHPMVMPFAHENDQTMNQIEKDVVDILRAALGRDAGLQIDASSELLGSVAELDSMAVVSILTSIEDHFGFSVADDEVDATTFASVASLCEFVRSKSAR